jgi:hypothetical protein
MTKHTKLPFFVQQCVQSMHNELESQLRHILTHTNSHHAYQLATQMVIMETKLFDTGADNQLMVTISEWFEKLVVQSIVVICIQTRHNTSIADTLKMAMQGMLGIRVPAHSFHF